MGKVFNPLPGVHPKRPSDKALAKYLQNECKTLSAQQMAGGKRTAPKKRATKNSNKSKAESDNDELQKAKDNAPKKLQSAYFLFSATVREELRKSDPTMKVTQISKEAGKRWRELGADEKKVFTDRAAKAKKEYTAAMDAYLASEEGKWLREDQKNKAQEKKDNKKAEKGKKAPKDKNAPKKAPTAFFLYLATVRDDIKKDLNVSKASDVAREGGKRWKALGAAEKKPFVDEANKLKEERKVKVAEYEAAKKKAEEAAEADGAVEADSGKAEAEAESETETTTTSTNVVAEAEESEKPKKKKKAKKAKKAKKGRGTKRKHDGVCDDLEPATKKRRLSDAMLVIETGPMSVLANLTDLVTGGTMVKPAMSPYGHVMEYDSWCSILRNPKTKNTCPFTQQPLTRRQLIKLDEHNIEEYKEQIVNLTVDELQKLSA